MVGAIEIQFLCRFCPEWAKLFTRSGGWGKLTAVTRVARRANHMSKSRAISTKFEQSAFFFTVRALVIFLKDGAFFLFIKKAFGDCFTDWGGWRVKVFVECFFVGCFGEFHLKVGGAIEIQFLCRFCPEWAKLFTRSGGWGKLVTMTTRKWAVEPRKGLEKKSFVIYYSTAMSTGMCPGWRECIWVILPITICPTFYSGWGKFRTECFVYFGH